MFYNALLLGVVLAVALLKLFLSGNECFENS